MKFIGKPGFVMAKRQESSKKEEHMGVRMHATVIKRKDRK
jgi:hypothetical protein